VFLEKGANGGRFERIRENTFKKSEVDYVGYRK